ncbi:ATP-binding cassette domain-containing protein [Paenibacillus larvae]
MRTEGIFAWLEQARIAYFSQELEGLNTESTILDSLLVLPEMTQTVARTILGCFLFSRDDVFKRIRDLSMGEKCRVAFLKLYFSGANLLVLDEPANYFDVETKEKVEQALQGFTGAFVVVSHDRYLIRKLATRLLFLGQDSVLFLYEGSWQEYEEEQNRKLQEPDNPEAADEVR